MTTRESVVKPEDIQTVLIIGSGTMGQQIGFQCAAHGYDVILHDISQEMLDTAIDRMGKLARIFVKTQRLSQDAADAALGRIRPEPDAEKAGGQADLISESVPEDPKLKAKVFARFNEICPKQTLFTTNTSSLLPSMFAESTGRPDRFAALHFHDVRYNNIVDVMPHPGTSRETVSVIEAFARKIGTIPIVLKKENNGYVFNAMLMELLKSAQSLAANDVAHPVDVDRAWMGVMGMDIGPFGIMDSIGIDTVWKVTDYWAKAGGDPQDIKNAEFLKPYVDSGQLGAKTGRGFYAYPKPAFSKPGFIQGQNE
ncbi:MAG: 3-hydroxyacyl-CoA dehydrogenase [Desulfobacterales bacterium]|nr:3-hydroxyacyl-CoA dehydrogenase [Desulfobacterales bacterium]